MISLAALRWLADQDASFVMLERNGSVLATTGPVRSSDAKLLRAQALAHHTGASLRITRELICRKLIGQEQVARHELLDSRTADTIAKFRAEVPTADSITMIRLIESQAARAYWSAWSTLPINFPKNDRGRVPDPSLAVHSIFRMMMRRCPAPLQFKHRDWRESNCRCCDGTFALSDPAIRRVALA
jgi:CRISPR/Cas system-associated endonuclease Cas1